MESVPVNAIAAAAPPVLNRWFGLRRGELLIAGVASATVLLMSYAGWWSIGVTEAWGFATGGICVWLVVRMTWRESSAAACGGWSPSRVVLLIDRCFGVISYRKCRIDKVEERLLMTTKARINGCQVSHRLCDSRVALLGGDLCLHLDSRQPDFREARGWDVITNTSARMALERDASIQG